MLCRRVPENKEKYYATDDARIIHYLIEHDIYPLYNDGAMFYFIRTEEFEKYMSMTDVNL